MPTRRTPLRASSCLAFSVTFFVLSLGTGCGVGSLATNAPTKNIFTPAITQTWLTQFGTGISSLVSNFPSDGALALATDASSNSFVAGYTLGAFPGYTGPIGIPRPFLTKLDSSGKQLWINEISTTGEVTGSGTDSSGSFLVAGWTADAFPGFANPTNTHEGFAIKVDGSGNTIWLQQSVVGGFSVPTAAATDPSGNLLVAGEWQASPTSSGRGIFVEKLRAGDGSVLWLQTYGGNTLDDINAIASDPAGNVLIAGDSTGPFPGNNNSQVGVSFVLKLASSDGSTVWLQQFGSLSLPPAFYLSSIASDSAGNVIAGGTVSTTFVAVNFGAPPGAECFLTKLDAQTGNVDWSKTFGTGSGDEIFAVTVGTTGSIYAAGATQGLFAQNYTSANNIFLLKFDPSGNNQWVQQIGNGITNSVGKGTSLAPAGDGGVILSGPTNGAYTGFSNPTQAAETFVAHFGP